MIADQGGLKLLLVGSIQVILTGAVTIMLHR